MHLLSCPPSEEPTRICCTIAIELTVCSLISENLQWTDAYTAFGFSCGSTRLRDNFKWSESVVARWIVRSRVLTDTPVKSSTLPTSSAGEVLVPLGLPSEL